MIVQQKLYTAADFWLVAHLPENSEKRLERVHRAIVEMPLAGGRHGDLASELNMSIRVFVKQRKLGYVTAAEPGYILFTDSLSGQSDAD